MQKAFDIASGESKAKDDPEIDLAPSDGEMVLTLTLSMGGIWKPEYAFVLLPVGLEKVDMLEAKVRDAQEEIEHLREQISAPAFLSVSSTVACGFGGYVAWNIPLENTASHYALAADNTQVSILMEGVYQVYVRLAVTNNGNTQSMGLQLNGNEVA